MISRLHIESNLSSARAGLGVSLLPSSILGLIIILGLLLVSGLLLVA